MASEHYTYLTREMLRSNVRVASHDKLSQFELERDLGFTIDIFPDLPMEFPSVADAAKGTPFDIIAVSSAPVSFPDIRLRDQTTQHLEEAPPSIPRESFDDIALRKPDPNLLLAESDIPAVATSESFEDIVQRIPEPGVTLDVPESVPPPPQAPDIARKQPEADFDSVWIEQSLNDAVKPSSDQAGFSLGDKHNIVREQNRITDEALALRQVSYDNVKNQGIQNDFAHDIQQRMIQTIQRMATDAGADFRNIDCLQSSLELHRNTITDINV